MPKLDDLYKKAFSHDPVGAEKTVIEARPSSAERRLKKRGREASLDALRAVGGQQKGEQPHEASKANLLPLGVRSASREEWEEHFQAVNKRERFFMDSGVEVPSGTQTGEQFRQLRTNILLYIQRARRNTVAFTSCHHGEGKTTTSVNLAKFIGMNRSHKVLLIDADLRRPKIRTMLNLKVDNGLEDVITGRCSLEDAIYYSMEHNLFVLPTYKGHSNAAEMLENQSFSNMLVRVSQLYDVVLIDTCPVLSTTDPTIIGSQIGSLMLVVKCSSTQRESILHTKNFVQQLGIKVPGVILTQMKFYIPRYFYRYHYYQDYYYYYYQKQVGEEEVAKT